MKNHRQIRSLARNVRLAEWDEKKASDRAREAIPPLEADAGDPWFRENITLPNHEIAQRALLEARNALALAEEAYGDAVQALYSREEV